MSLNSAVVCPAFGLEHLLVEDRPVPVPGPGEVLVRLHASSLNYRDYMTVMGMYNPRLRLPVVPCSDGAGEIISLGEGVEDWRVGDRVLPNFSLSYMAGTATRSIGRSALGGPLDGCLQRYRCFPASALVAIPEHLTYEEAATLPCAGITAWNALVTMARLRPGDVVLVQGTGGVSMFALQFARMLGCRVIVTSSSDEKLERARDLGAHHLINYKKTPRWGKEAAELAGGEGVDLVVEVGGAGTLEQSIIATRMMGQISLIGVLAGAAQELNIVPIFMKAITVQGIFVGHREDLQTMTRAIAAHQMRPVVDARRFLLSEVRAAFEYMANGQHFGKIAITIP